MEICLTAWGVQGPEEALRAGGGLPESCRALRRVLLKLLRSWSQSSLSPVSPGRGASSEETEAFSSPALGTLERVREAKVRGGAGRGHTYTVGIHHHWVRTSPLVLPPSLPFGSASVLAHTPYPSPPPILLILPGLYGASPPPGSLPYSSGPSHSSDL